MALTAFGLMPSGADAQFFSSPNWPGAYPGRTSSRLDGLTERPIRRRVAPRYPKLVEAPKNDQKPQGPLLITVSIEKQWVKIYDERGLFAESPISSGTKAHPTPMGVFSIIEKSKWHRSNLYSDAPMPFMQRITWSGVALHAGELPGYPASHGCIRLPAQFAARLWNWTKRGARVIVTPGEMSVADVSHKNLVAQLPSPIAAIPAASSGTIAEVRTADASSTLSAGIRSDASKATTFTIETTLRDNASNSTTKTQPAEPTVVETKTSDDKASDDKASDDKTSGDKTGDAKDASSDQPSITATAAPDTKAEDAKAEDAKAEDKIAATPEPPQGDSRAPTAEASVAPREQPVWMQLPKRSGQVSVLISRKDGKLYMRQNFDQVFEIPVTFTSDSPIGTHVFTVRKATNDNTAFEWTAVTMPGIARTVVSREPYKTPKGKTRMRDAFHTTFGPTPVTASEALDRIAIPEEALQRIAFHLSAGSSIVVSDLSFSAGGETGRGTEFIVPLR